MEKPKGKNRVWKCFKLIEETTKQLEERSKVENMNESEYIRYLFLKSVGTSVKYRDLFDFSNKSAYSTTGSITDRYFVKGMQYKMQNEWRMVIGGEYKPLELNCFDGYFINSTPFQYAMLMKTEEFMEGINLVEREE